MEYCDITEAERICAG